MKTKSKILSWLIGIAVIAIAALIYFKFYFVFGEGMKAGELNQFMYKGWIWKTYEGRLIQTGFKGTKDSKGIQSNEFNFSVKDKTVAEELMKCSGKHVELHYKEYNGMLPWRGMQKYVVDKIVAFEELKDDMKEIPFEVF